MAKKKNSRKLDELQVSLLDDKDFLKGIIETFCQRLSRRRDDSSSRG